MCRLLGLIAAILLVAVMPGGQAAGAPAKRVALVIGNAAYVGITPLQKSIKDAEKVAEVLKGFGYDVTLASNATLRDLNALAAQFSAKLIDADVGFFYYSGHGFQTNHVDQAHPINHIVPVDFELERADAALVTLPLDSIIQPLRVRARAGFVFMDACRNDPRLAAASVRIGSGPKAVTISRGFSPYNAGIDPPDGERANTTPSASRLGTRKIPAGLLIAYATDPGNVALEGNVGELSPFTTALVKHIATPGLSAAQILGLVSEEVSDATGGKQTPWSVFSRTVGAHVFLPKPEKVTQPTAPAKQKSVPVRTSPAPRAPPFQVQ
jgi:uncharacterized caspase-like protein